MKAIWNNRVIAESDDIINVEGNMYFPAESVNKEFLKIVILIPFAIGRARLHIILLM